MSHLSLLGRAVNVPLRAVGLELRRMQPASDATRAPAAPTCLARLEQIRRLGFSPRAIYDCGGFVGSWSRAAARLFPGAQIVVVEPNPAHLDAIRAATAGIEPPPILVDAAVGAACGAVTLNLWGDDSTALAGASLLAHVAGEPSRRIDARMLTLDRIAEQTGVLPDLLKLDLQGYELPALRGGERVLAHAEVAVVEFGCLEAYVGRTTPRDLVDWMYDRSFRLYDIVDLHYRPYDGALCSGDFFFVRESSALRRHKGYS